MTNVLFINASPRGSDSAAAQGAEIFRAALSEDVNFEALDLFSAALPEYTPELAAAKQKTMMGMALEGAEAEQWRGVETLVEQFLQVDHFLLAIPMWNFTIPYKFKQYIDLITHPGMTFKMDKDGPRGINSASGTVIYARGGSYSPKDGVPDPFDFQSPYMRAWCSLVGITPLTDVLVQGTMGGPDAQAAALEGARAELEQLAGAIV